jgi:NitT/TauT family transport system substrate-binding protein
MTPRWVSLLLILVAGTACQNSSTPTGNATPVTLQLNWYPEAEHGGFFAAEAHGYFAEEGLSVRIIKGGPDSPVVQQVAQGERTFGVCNADNVLFGRAQQAAVVAVFAALQTSPRCLLAHQEANIDTFADLKDVTLSMSATPAFAHFLEKKLPLQGVKIVPYSGSLAPFLENPRAVQQGYSFSEPFLAEQHGAKVRTLMLADIGFNPYTSLLIASESTLANQPELVAKMVRAVSRGWAKYLDDPAATNELIHKLNPEMELAVLEFGAKALRALVRTDEAKLSGLGTMSLNRWETLAQQLVEIGQLKEDQIDPVSAFTTRYLEKVAADARTP